LDAAGQVDALQKTTSRMKDAGIEVSLFITPDPEQVEAAARIGASFIELHTGAYAHAFESKQARQAELDRLIAASRMAHGLGLRVNAGHGLNTRNLPLLHLVPHLVELNIGHSIVSRSLFVGLEQAVKEILEAMKGYPG
jgi:pyridoxine 5-phosphate synthase